MSIYNTPSPEIQVGVTGFMTTTNPSDTFAITHPFYSSGGFKYCDTFTDMEAILPSRRIPEITMAYVLSIDTWFQLQGGIDNTDWVSLGAEPFGASTPFDSYKGLYVSVSALTTAHPTSVAGDYADVDTGTGTDAERYIWDNDDNIWVKSSVGSALTATQVKTLYESNSDTNPFTDSDSTKLDGISAGAEVNVNSDWNATTGDAEILNKPIIPVNTSDLNNDSGFTGDQTDSEIEIAYNNQVDIVNQVDAEAGISTDVFRWTPERVKQLAKNLVTLQDVINANSTATTNNDTSITFGNSSNFILDSVNNEVDISLNSASGSGGVTFSPSSVSMDGGGAFGGYSVAFNPGNINIVSGGNHTGSIELIESRNRISHSTASGGVSVDLIGDDNGIIVHSGSGNPTPTTRLDIDGDLRIRDIQNDNILDEIIVKDSNGKLFYRDASTIGGVGSGVTNLSYNSSTRTIESDAGTNAILPLATASDAGLLSASDKDKLDKIENEANSNLITFSTEYSSDFNVPLNSTKKEYSYNSGTSGVATVRANTCEIGDDGVLFTLKDVGALSFTNGAGVNPIITTAVFTELSIVNDMCLIIRLPDSGGNQNYKLV